MSGPQTLYSGQSSTGKLRKPATLWSLLPTWALKPYAPSPIKPVSPPHPSKQPLIKRDEQREGMGRGHCRGGEGRHRNCGLGGSSAQPLLARRDRMDGQQAPELEVLDHRELLQALGLIHADETLVHFGPGRDSADVPQLVGVLCKWASLHLPPAELKEMRKGSICKRTKVGMTKPRYPTALCMAGRVREERADGRQGCLKEQPAWPGQEVGKG